MDKMSKHRIAGFFARPAIRELKGELARRDSTIAEQREAIEKHEKTIVMQANRIAQQSVLELMLRDQALTDPLTGLGNRRLLEDRLGLEEARSHRTGVPFTVLVLDLNGLKRINDKLGHDIGDQLIISAARAIEQAIRDYDTAVRTGGDEFVAILSGVGAKGAGGRIAEIRKSFEAKVISVSIGSASSDADGGSKQTLLEIADKRMFIEKSGFPDARK